MIRKKTGVYRRNGEEIEIDFDDRPVEVKKLDMLKERRPDIFDNAKRIGGTADGIRKGLEKFEKVKRKPRYHSTNTEPMKVVNELLSTAFMHVYRRDFSEAGCEEYMGCAKRAFRDFSTSRLYKRLPEAEQERLKKLFISNYDLIESHFDYKKRELRDALKEAKENAEEGNAKKMFENIWFIRSHGIRMPSSNYDRMRKTVKKKIRKERRKAMEETKIFDPSQLELAIIV